MNSGGDREFTLAIVLSSIAIIIMAIILVAIFIVPEPPQRGPATVEEQSKAPAPKKYDGSEGWVNTKNVLYNVIYKGHNFDLYYGCKYNDHNQVDLSTCDYKPVEKHKSHLKYTEVEHIIPASLLPARRLSCWTNGSRGKCENEEPRAQSMIFDLHDLAPAVGQVNQLRSNFRYGEKGMPGTFEPQDCIKGDVARVWLYGHLRHGVELLPGEEEMFQRWSKMDPISPWESEREKRIAKYTFVINPFVHGQPSSVQGACPWEKP